MPAAEDTSGTNQPHPSAVHRPFVPDEANLPEFTWPAVVVGALLGIIFGASSLYLVLKVGMTVSASIPVAVMSITLFRVFSRAFGFRRATILENNIVQTTGSAGESIAFGVGVTMPALMLLGFEMDVTRVMVVSVLGGVLGILMMIPLRRAFIVKQHGTLTLSRRDRLRRRADRGRARRRNGQDGLRRLRHRLCLPVSPPGDEALAGHPRPSPRLVSRGRADHGSGSHAAGRWLHYRHADRVPL